MLAGGEDEDDVVGQKYIQIIRINYTTPMPDEVIDAITKVVELPEGALPTVGIVVIGYIDGEGVGRYTFRPNEGADCSHLVGLLGMTAHQIEHEISYDLED